MSFRWFAKAHPASRLQIRPRSRCPTVTRLVEAIPTFEPSPKPPSSPNLPAGVIAFRDEAFTRGSHCLSLLVASCLLSATCASASVFEAWNDLASQVVKEVKRLSPHDRCRRFPLWPTAPPHCKVTTSLGWSRYLEERGKKKFFSSEHSI